MPNSPGVRVLLALDPALRGAELQRFLRETGSFLLLVSFGIGADSTLVVEEAILPDSTGMPRRLVLDADEVSAFLKDHPGNSFLYVCLDRDPGPVRELIARGTPNAGLFVPHLVFSPRVVRRIWKRRADRLGPAAATSRAPIWIRLVPDEAGNVDLEVTLEDESSNTNDKTKE